MCLFSVFFLLIQWVFDFLYYVPGASNIKVMGMLVESLKLRTTKRTVMLWVCREFIFTMERPFLNFSGST